MKKGGRRAQATIFIIIAIVVVGVFAILYAFVPQIRTTFSAELKNPQAFMQSCLEGEIESVIDNLSLQGGVLNPELYYEYKLNKLRYLCYTNEYYKLCTVQDPILKNTIESEIQTAISKKADECFDELQKSYRDKGYSVTINKGTQGVELLPKRVVASFNHTLTIKKDTAETYTSFMVTLNNNIYELSSIAMSIIDFETTYGDAETTFYMSWYKDLKVEKLKQSDGTTLYILSDRNTNKKFQFASRSMVWKPGYSYENTI